MSSIMHQDETAEERSARIDGILKKNSIQGVCIACGGDILGTQEIVDSIHGKYHGSPLPCVDGRA